MHTDELYVRKTKELMERVGVSHIMLKDSGGLLTVDRVRTLVPALKQVLGDIPLDRLSINIELLRAAEFGMVVTQKRFSKTGGIDDDSQDYGPDHAGGC